MVTIRVQGNLKECNGDHILEFITFLNNRQVVLLVSKLDEDGVTLNLFRGVLRLAFNVAASEQDLPITSGEVEGLLGAWVDKAATEGRPLWKYEVLS